MKLSAQEQQHTERRLAIRYASAGEEARERLEQRLAALSPEEAALTRWCYAASPLSDWANYDFSLFRAHAAHALHLRTESPLAAALPEGLFLNYVLHPRVNEEELCDCRAFFAAQLRDRVAGLPAREAALAVNEWCAEQVCYRATDERTSAARNVWRSGFGRCGEESTFAVNALRAVGLPARQVYTPRWAHCDDNHAWVEVFCDGAWHYLGACEPEPVLDRGWFTGAAGRALLVHSRCFGTPEADDDVISVDGAVTFLNQTARYAPVRTAEVRVREANGHPAAGAEVTFGILNASEVFPAAVVRTDEAGTARLHCGFGTLLVSARKNGRCCEALYPAAQTALCLTLKAPEAPSERWREFRTQAPKDSAAPRARLAPEARALFAEKAAAAAQARRGRAAADLDPAREQALAARFGDEIGDILRRSYGNFKELAEFLETAAFSDAVKLALLRTLSEKDLRDVQQEVLREALSQATNIPPEDDFTYRYVICPRIGAEPLRPCRAALRNSFSAAEQAALRAAPERIWDWIAANFRTAPVAEYRQLVTLPGGALRLRCADLRSQQLLFVALCRALGVPARLDPISGAAEFWHDGRFLSPEAGLTATATLRLCRQPGENWEPGADFGLAVLESGAWRALALPEAAWDGNALALALRPGVYRVLTDNRLPNGDIYAAHMELSLAAGETKSMPLHKQPVAFAALAVDFTLADFSAETADGRPTDAAALTQTPALLLWLEAGSEPTEHLLNELLAQKARLAALPLRVVFLLRDRQALQNEKLRAAREAFPAAEICFSADSAEPAARSAYVAPDQLPLLLLCDTPRHILQATPGYHIGSLTQALNLFLAQRRPH